MLNLLSPLIKIYKALYLFAYDITGNYGYALILLSLITFIVLYPFNKKAQQLQNKEHKIQSVLMPQIEKIKKQFRGREQYEQLQWLYQRYGYHPLYAIRSALGLIFQIPFLTAAYYMLSGLVEIQGVAWGRITNLSMPDHLLAGINLLPFLMTFVTCVYAFLMPEISKKGRLQTVAIGVFFLVVLYSAPSALLIFWTCNLIWSLLDSVLSKKLAWIGEYIVTNELAFHIFFALSLTVGILVPTDIYLKNASQLWFNYSDVLKYFLTDVLQYFVAFLVTYIACWNKKVQSVYLSVLLGILFGVFLQSYIIGVNYGLFDGHVIKWEEYAVIGLLNSFIWLFCLGAAFVLFGLLTINNNKKTKRIVKPIAFAIVAIQCIVLLVTLKNNPVQKITVFDNGKVGILTNKDIYTVSSKQNIIVFLIDAFDAEIFENILVNKPEEIVHFKDFTFYPNTTSSFGFTIYSLPEILTGSLFDPSIQKYPDFIDKAFKENKYYKTLLHNDYVIDLYTSGDFVSKNAPIDNLITEQVVLDDNMIKKFKGLVKFRLAPHYLKKLYYQYDSNLQNSMIVNKNVQVYRFDDSLFYSNLKQGLKITDDSNCFKFYHLEGMHYPWNYDENMEPLKEDEQGTAQKTAIGRLRIVNEFMKQLQNHKLYNDATIVILADHGYNHQVGRRPLFMVKQPHEHSNSINLNNRASTVSELMSFICKKFEYPFSDGTKFVSTIETPRVFYSENQDGDFIKYLIKGVAKEKESWILAGKVEKYRDGDRKYYLGETIDFSLHGNSERYKGHGWSINPNIRYSDIALFEADMFLDVMSELKQDNYLITLRVHPLLNDFNMPYKVLNLYANNQKVGSWSFVIDDFEDVTCIIPKEIMRKRALTLRFVVDVPKHFANNEEVFFNAKFVVEKMQIIAYY